MSIAKNIESLFLQKEEERARLAEEELQRQVSEDFLEARLKTISLRLDPFTLMQLDGLAVELEESRQAMLSLIVDEGIRDALEGYFGVFEKDAGAKLASEFHDRCRQAVLQGKTYKELVYSDSEGAAK